MNNPLRTRIVFWLNSPSPHQAGYVRHLAATHQVTFVCSGNLSSQRVALGWEKGDFGRTRLLIEPQEAEIEEQIWTQPSSSVHIFSFLHRSPLNRKAYAKVATTEAIIGLFAEGRDWRGLKGMLRRAESFTYERRIAERLDFILAVGWMSLHWHSMCGIPEEKIFPFAYFPPRFYTSLLDDADASSMRPQRDPTPEVRLVFVGQLIPLKRVHLLLQALATFQTLPWRLTIIGDGPEKIRLEKMAKDLGLANRIAFTGILKNTEVPQAISEADLLVLPSIWDGWGAVVNEALGVGVPVVCSDFCGAKVLLKGERGETFPVDSVQGLAEVLRRRILAGRLSPEARNRIRSWAAHVSGESGANYLGNILHHLELKQNGTVTPRPIAPWLNK